MRKGLAPEDLGDLLEQPRVAVLATYRRDGTVLLSPVWHEWRDRGFHVPRSLGHPASWWLLWTARCLGAGCGAAPRHSPASANRRR